MCFLIYWSKSTPIKDESYVLKRFDFRTFSITFLMRSRVTGLASFALNTLALVARSKVRSLSHLCIGCDSRRHIVRSNEAEKFLYLLLTRILIITKEKTNTHQK